MRDEIKFELRYWPNLTVMCPLQVLPLVRANEARQIQIGAGHCEFIAILAENSDFRVCSSGKKQKKSVIKIQFRRDFSESRPTNHLQKDRTADNLCRGNLALEEALVVFPDPVDLIGTREI